METIVHTIENQNNILIIGETGTTDNLAEYLFCRMMNSFQTAIGRYNGTPKRFLQSIALDLGISTVEAKVNSKGEVTGDRELTVDQLKEKMLETIGRKH